jgi:hypothetical protein
MPGNSRGMPRSEATGRRDRQGTSGESRLGNAAIAPRCSCGSSVGELLRCRANNGIAWRCPRCLRVLSAWIGHGWLVGVDIDALPDWNAPAHDDVSAASGDSRD